MARALIKNQLRPVPAEVCAAFPGLAERLAQVDAGFDTLPTDEEGWDEHEPEPEPVNEFNPEPVTVRFPEPDPTDDWLAKPTDNLSVKEGSECRV